MAVSILVLMDIELKQGVYSRAYYGEKEVSILVLMDIELKRCGKLVFAQSFRVSILVLMDIELKHEVFKDDAKNRYAVSILVLMDIELKPWPTKYKGNPADYCFNPCFNGYRT